MSHEAECFLAQPCPGIYFTDRKPGKHNWTNAEQAWTPETFCHRCRRSCECSRFRECISRVRTQEWGLVRELVEASESVVCDALMAYHKCSQHNGPGSGACRADIKRARLVVDAVLDYIDGPDVAAVPHPATQDGEAGR